MDNDYIRAGSARSTSDTLQTLSSSKIAVIRRRVAENPKTPASILLKLATDLDPDIRMAVALNRATPIDVLKRMLRDSNADVRRSSGKSVDGGSWRPLGC